MTAAGPDPTRQHRSQSADGQVLGAVLVLGGIGWLLDRAGVDLSWRTILSALLITVGIGMVMTARRRGGPGLFVLGAALTAVLVAASSVDPDLLREGIDDRLIVVTDVTTAGADADDEGSLLAGQLEVDLSRLTVSETSSPTRLRYRVGVGHLVLRLPPASTVPVQVNVTTRGGKVELPRGRVEKGSHLELTHTDPEFDRDAPDRVTIDLAVTFGAVQVVRETRETRETR